MNNATTNGPGHTASDAGRGAAQAIQIVNSKPRYSLLTDEEKALLERYLNADPDALEQLEDLGYSLPDALPYGRAVRYCSRDIHFFTEHFPSAEEIRAVLDELGENEAYFEGIGYLPDLKARFIGHILQGRKARALLEANSVAMALGMDMAELLPTDETDAGDASEAGYSRLAAAARTFNLNAARLIAYARETGAEDGELAEQVAKTAVLADLPRIALFAEGVPTVPEPTEDKQYNDAPFVFRKHENIQLNSGTLEYTVPDFTLPGKNGLDLSISRRYNSSTASLYEYDTKCERKTMYYFNVNVKYPGYSKTVCDWDGMYANHNECRSDCLKSYNEMRAMGGGEGESYSYEIKEKTEYQYVTGQRENTHLPKVFGLGAGWSFSLPSIEKQADGYRKDRVTYNDYLHMPTGGCYKIDFSSKTNASNLTDYKQTDIQLTKQSGSVTLSTGGSAAYDHYLAYKDGKRFYFYDGKPVVEQDRFGNTIHYTFTDNGGATIVDSLGQTIRLVKSGSGSNYTLTWQLPDSTRIQYSIAGKLLTSVTDQENRVTGFQYGSYGAYARYHMNISGDNGTTVYYSLLTKVIHPTKAETRYAYLKHEVVTKQKYDQKFEFYGIESRKELLDPKSIDPENTVEEFHFSYKFTGRKITESRVTKPDDVVHIHTFNTQGYPTEETVEHAMRQVSHTRFTYNDNNQLIQQTETTYNPDTKASIQRVSKWTYDEKGNVLTETDPMNSVSTMTYHPTYSLLTSKVTPKDNSTSIREEYTLGNNNTLVHWHKIFEVAGGQTVQPPKQATQYVYDSTHKNLVETRRFYGNMSALNTYYSTYYDYANTNPALGSRYNNIFPTTTRQTGILDADGKPAWGDGVVERKTRFDHFGRAIQETDPMGHVTKKEYDGLGRPLKETYPDNSFQTYVYNDLENSIVATDANGNAKKMTYNPLGLIAGVVDVESGCMLHSYEYDHLSRPKREVKYDENGPMSAIINRYDRFGRVVAKTVTDGVGIVVAEELYAFNNAYSSTLTREEKTVVGEGDAPSITAVAYQDKLGNMVQQGPVIDGVERLTVFTYDKMGNRLTSRTALDAQRGLAYSQKWEYNFAGQVVKEYNALGDYATTTYDPLGNKISFVDFRSNREQSPYATSTVYDALGQELKISTPFESKGGTIYYRQIYRYYDRADNLLEEKTTRQLPGNQAQFNRTCFVYDNRGRMVDTRIFDGDQVLQHTHIEYDHMSNKVATHVESALGRRTLCRNTFNRYNKITTATDALGQMERSVYDATGKLLAKTDRNGNTTAYTLDALERQIFACITSANGKLLAEHTTLYAKSGAMLQEQNDDFVVSYRHDERGLLIAEREPNGIQKSYRYDWNGNRIAFQLLQGSKVLSNAAYTYDHLNRMETVREDGELAATYTYDANGNRSTLTGPGSESTYRYNLFNQPVHLTNKQGDKVVSFYDYVYFLDGNQATKTDHTGRITSYTYDGAGQLTAEAESTGLELRYQYDSFGNRTALDVSGSENYSVVYRYDANNRLLQDTKVQDAVTTITRYRYDPNGNQVEKHTETISPNTGAGHAMGYTGPTDSVELREYNAFGQLSQVYTGGKIAAYRYTPQGLRFEKVVDNRKESHIWRGTDLVAELDASGELLAKNIRGIGLLARHSNGEKTGYYFNAHGDVVQKALYNSADVCYYDYDAFGVERTVNPLDSNPFRYCGEYYDAETDTIYLRARYYCASIGRFLAEDPINDNLNWYTYCGNNPIIHIDPAGLEYSYVFYGPDQAGAADEYVKQLKEAYPETKVRKRQVRSAEEFKAKWAAIGGDVEIDGMVINVHGSPTAMAPDGAENGILSISDIEQLASYEMDFMYLGSCNTGHMDYRNSNVANAFARTQKTKYGVIAPDGTHTRPNPDKDRIQSIAKANKEFERLRDAASPESTRLSQGFIIYYPADDGRIRTTRFSNMKEEKKKHKAFMPDLVTESKQKFDKRNNKGK